MTDIRRILYEICEDERVFDEETDLIESGLLDSYAVIELFCRLEDEGTELQITQIDRELLRTAKGIEELIAKAK
ncbi:MAG: hypothetical protein IJP05_03320 [Oscillospiraceae bacterium]|nr:hypothetical protein [Oscillospiraceae bacterium]